MVTGSGDCTRRDLLKLASMGVVGTSLAGPSSAPFGRRNLVGLMGVMMSSSGNSEEEMYKEIFLALMGGYDSGVSLPIDIYDENLTWLVGGAMMYRGWSKEGQSNRPMFNVSFPNLVSIGVGGIGGVFKQSGVLSVNLPKLENCYGGSNFDTFIGTEINLPALKNFSNHEFSYSQTLKTLRLPSVTSKSGSFFVYQDTTLEHVYLPKMTLSALGGASYIRQQNCNSAAVFHLQDGDYDYQGNPVS